MRLACGQDKTRGCFRLTLRDDGESLQTSDIAGRSAKDLRSAPGRQHDKSRRGAVSVRRG